MTGTPAFASMVPQVPGVRELLDRIIGRAGDVRDLSAPTEIRVITGVSEREISD
jgi:hypothetical protein